MRKKDVGFVEYIKPSNLEELLCALSRNSEGSPIAGGTDLIVRKRAGKAQPSCLIDLLIPELQMIREEKENIVIGAAVSLSDLAERFSSAGQPYQMLAQAALSVGSCQTRNLATIGGNLCTGNASADLATALLALDASVLIEKSGAARVLPLDRFFLKNRCVALEKGEIVSQILIPRIPAGSAAAAFLKIGKRRGHVIAILNTAAVLHKDQASGKLRARFAAGTLAPTPIRLYQCETCFSHLMEKGIAFEEALQLLDEVMRSEIDPRSSRRASREYRMQVAPAALRRVTETAWREIQ